MVVRFGIGIKIDLTGIDIQLTQQAMPTEEVEGVVNGSLRGLTSPTPCQFIAKLFGTQVLRPRKKQFRDVYPLSGGIDFLALQQLDDFVLIHANTPNWRPYPREKYSR
jgi:hypothetical protein